MIEKRLRLSGRLWLLVLLALLPVFVLQLNAARLRFDDVERFARVQVTRFVSYAGAFQGDFLMDAETIMAIAARQADIAEAAPGECDVALGYVLTDSAQRRKIFHSLTLARPDGSVLCSALPFSAGLSMADQTYFRNAIQSGRFAIGERMIDPVSKQLALMVAEPIKNEAGELVSILVGAIDLTPAMRLAEPLLTPGAAMAVFMDDGSHLLRMPVIEGIDLSRTKVPGPLLEAARAADVGTVVTAGIDGVERLYATRKIPLFGNLVYVALGYPNDAIFAPAKAELWRTIGVILLVTAVALVLSWLLGNFMIRRPLRELLTATEKLSAGDFKARTKIRGKSEIDDLMAAFNRTAESLEKHEDAVQSEVARRRRTEHSLKETNNRLMAIIESSPLAIVGLSAKSEVILWNRASENLFSFDSSEVMDQPSPLAAAEGDDPFAGLFAQARRGKAIREMRIKLRRKGEGSFEARFSGGPIRGQAGEFHGLIYVIEDVTHTKQVEAQLAQSQRMEAVGQLTGGIAHDFNNLLGVVIGNLDLARETPKLDPDVVEPLEASTNAALRGAELTRQLLAFSRRQPLHAKALGLNDLVKTTTHLLKRTLGESIEISLVQDAALWPALADRAQVESALTNLSINARDAMPKGGRLTVETHNAHLDQDYARMNPDVKPGDYVMLAVTDTGTGMAPEVVARVFEPFFTTKAPGKGTGLGLSMVYGFAKQSGGHVKIYSEVGHGTTIRLYLPRALTEAAEQPVVETQAPRGKGETLLVVEDNDDVRTVVTSQLGRLGYNVVPVENANLALERLESGQPFDMLFTDVIMPGKFGGRELATAARQMRPDLHILLTSGFTADSQAQIDHSFELLSKPYRYQDLARKIRETLDEPPPVAGTASKEAAGAF